MNTKKDKPKKQHQKYTNKEKHNMLAGPVNLWFANARKVTENWTKETDQMKAIGFGLKRRAKTNANGEKVEANVKKQDSVQFIKVGTSIHILFRKEKIRIGVLAWNKKKQRYVLFLASHLGDGIQKYTNKHYYLFLSLRRAIINNLICHAIASKMNYKKLKDNTVVDFAGLLTVLGMSAAPVKEVSVEEFNKWISRHKIASSAFATNAGPDFGKEKEGKSKQTLMNEVSLLNSIEELTKFRADNA